MNTHPATAATRLARRAFSLQAFRLSVLFLLALPPALHAQSGGNYASSGTVNSITASGGNDTARFVDTDVSYMLDDSVTLTILAAASMSTNNQYGIAFETTDANPHNYTVTPFGLAGTGTIIYQGFAAGPATTRTNRNGSTFYLNGSGATMVKITNAIFTGNNATGQNSARGGAIFMDVGADIVTLANVSFIANSGSSYRPVAASGNATSQGGAIFMGNSGPGVSTLALNTGVFANNNVQTVTEAGSASGYGGAIAILAGSGSLANVSFNGNFASPTASVGNASAYGGAIYISQGTLALNTASFAGNNASASVIDGVTSGNRSATAKGGAVYIEGATIVSINSGTFTGNQAAGYGRNTISTASNHGTAYGGAIDLASGTLTISTAIFTSNTALTDSTLSSYESRGYSYGGALAIEGGTLGLNNVFFGQNNVTAVSALTNSAYGGAIAVMGGEATISSATFSNNNAYASATDSRGYAYGGAVAVEGGTLTLHDVIFNNNNARVDATQTSNAQGGAIAATTNAVLLINNGTFINNSVSGTGSSLSRQGGAFYQGSGATSVLTNAVFISNTSVDQGGAAFINGVVTTQSNVLYKDNISTGNSGGAVFLGGNAAGIDQSTFASATFQGNVAFSNGGAMVANTSSNLLLTDAAFLNNTAGGNAGALNVQSSSTVTITRGLFDGNKTAPDPVAQPDNGGNGGAIQVSSDGSTLTLNDVTLTNNTATGTSGLGGALYINNVTTVTLNAVNQNLVSAGNIAAGANSTGAASPAADATAGGFAYLTGAATLNLNAATGRTLTIGSAASTAADSLASSDAYDAGGDIQTLNINSAPGNTGSVLLHADSSAYAGLVNLAAGSLILANSGAKLGGKITVASGASLGGLGNATGLVDLTAPGAILTIGNDHSTATATASTFTIGGTLALNPAGGAIFQFDLISDGVNDKLLINAFDSNGLTAGNYIYLNTIAAGAYTLMSLTGGDTFADSATQAFITTKNGEALSGRISSAYSLANAATDLVLTLEKANYVRAWSAPGGAWDASTANWTGADGVDNLFLDGDRVTFADAASGAVAISAGGVIAADMTVDTASAYTFTGGPITTDASSVGLTDATFGAPATGKLTKNGPGTLILDNGANNFTAGIDLNSGTLQGNALTLGPAAITAAANTAIVFNQVTSGAYTGVITGVPAISKIGSGALTLSTANQFAAATAITLADGVLNTNSLDQLLNNLTGSGAIATGAAASTLTLATAATSTYSGVISGAAGLAKTGAATLVLAADNTYTGPTTIATGTLQLGAGAAAGGVLGTITNNTALVVDHGAADSTLAAALAGAGTFTKLGAGALNLTANSSGNTGATEIAAGALILKSTAQLGGPVTVDANATLAGSGVANGSVTVLSNGALIAGDTHNVTAPTGTLTINGALTLTNNSTLKYDIYDDGLSDLITVNSLSLTGSATIDLNAVGTGAYTLLTSAASLSALNLATTFHTTQNGNALTFRTSDQYSLSADTNSLLLTLETANLSITWAGTTGNTWATLTDNWSGNDTQFVTSDKVTFGNTGAGGITIAAAGVQVSDMVVNSDADYTFTGGAITTTTNPTGLAGATGKLTKTGAGSLTLSNASATFIGGIEIDGGSLRGNTDTLNVTPTGTIINNATLIFDQPADAGGATYSNAIIGTGSLAKTGASALTLDNPANTYIGGISVDTGTLTLLNAGDTPFGTFNIAANAALFIVGDSFTLDHAPTGAGTLTVNLTSPDAIYTLDPAALGSSYAGTLNFGQGILTLDTGAALANAALNLGPGNVTTVATGTHFFSSLSLNQATLIFTATTPPAKNATSMISVANLNLTGAATIQITIPDSIPATQPPTSSNLLEQDDITDGVCLIAATGTVTGNGTQFYLKDQNGADIDLSRDKTIDITKSAADTTIIAEATYGYKLGTNNARDGFYIGYALKTLDIADNQTLELAANPGAGESASTMSALIGGNGSLRIDASNAFNNTIIIDNNNNYAGSTEVAAGTAKAGSDNAFGSTSQLTIAAAATVDLDSYTQGARMLNNLGTLAIGTGTFTVQDTGASAGTLTGAPGGVLAVFDYATLDIKGANPNFHASTLLGANATLTLDTGESLGSGGLLTFNQNSTAIVNNGGTLAARLASASSGAGTLVVNNGVAAPAAIRAGALAAASTGETTLTGDSSAFTGIIQVLGGDLVLKDTARLGDTALIQFAGPTARVVYDHITAGNLGANLNGTGAILVRNNSRMTLDRDLADYAVQLDASTLAFSHPNPLDEENFLVLSVKNLAGSGTLVFNVNFGRAKSDQLAITNPADGAGANIAIAINPVSNRRSDPASTITLITGAATDATFTLAGDEILAPGGNLFQLYQGGGNKNIADPGTWYLAASNQMGHAMDAIINNAVLLGVDWNYELDSLNKRMGEVRRELYAEGAPSGGNLWLNANAYKLNGSGDMVKGGLQGYKFDQKVYGVTVGGDKLLRKNDETLLAGAFLGMTSIDRTFDNQGDGNTDAINLGLYLSWIHKNGLFADLTVKYNNYKNKFNAHTGGGGDTTADYNSNALGASLEVGYYISASSGWWCEPSAQVSYVGLQSVNYTTNTGMQVAKSSANSVQSRVMVRWGKTFGARLDAYLKAAVADSNTKDGNIVVSYQGAQSNPGSLDINGLRTEFGMGATYALNARSQLWLDYEYAKAANYTKPWSFNAGYRLLW